MARKDKSGMVEPEPVAEPVARFAAYDSVLHDLACAVDELRAREAGGPAEVDLAEVHADASDGVQGDARLAPLAAAVALLATEGVTADAVLDALGEADRALVATLAAALAVEDHRGETEGALEEPSIDGSGRGWPDADNPLAAAWGIVRELVAEGRPLEEANDRARAASLDEAGRRAALRAIIANAESELRSIGHAARSAQKAALRLAHDDRDRQRRLRQAVAGLADAARVARVNGQPVSEAVQAVLEAAARGEPMTSAMVGA